MRQLLVPGLLACLAGGPAAADVRAAAGVWRYELSGSARDGTRFYDFEQDLELESSGRGSLLIEWDTPRGWWPDLAASFSELGAAGEHEETFTLLAGGVPVATQTRTILTTADFDDWDVTLRYPIALGPVRAAAGVAIKRLRGELVIDDSNESGTQYQTYDEIFPQVHAQLRWPVTGWLTLAAAGQGITHDGSAAREWRAGVEMRLKWALLELGWQQKLYDIDVEEYALDANLRGWLLRLGAAW